MATEIFCRKAKQWLKLDMWNYSHPGQCSRYLTSGEVSTALRPFYFTVHPDLFGQFPLERAVNENSLKVLSYILESLQQKRPQQPTTLRFYLRPQGTITTKENLKSVCISLAQQDLKKTVTAILSTCNLPTTYVDSIAPEPLSRSPHTTLRSRVYTYTEQAEKHYEEYDYTNNSRIKRPEKKTKPPKEFQSLRILYEVILCNKAGLQTKVSKITSVILSSFLIRLNMGKKIRDIEQIINDIVQSITPEILLHVCQEFR